MKVLYAFQGTGNGHAARAREIVPNLLKKCETDVLISGTQFDIDFPFSIKYRLFGLGFIFGKNGGIDIWNTYLETNFKRFKKEIKNLPVEDYDLVINDFEPVSAWACMKKGIPCISVSHQCALTDKNVPKITNSDKHFKFLLKHYAPSHRNIGLHFCNYSKHIFTPVIRSEIRKLSIKEDDYYIIYLPSFNTDKLIKTFSRFNEVKWKIFAKHQADYQIINNIEIYPLSNDEFINSLASCKGIICGAGFETPSEALYLGKKLMIIPMKNQFEQQYNAVALKSIGIPVIKKFKKIQLMKIEEWIRSDYKIQIDYPDITNVLINKVFEIYIDDLSKTKLKRKKIKLFI